LHPPPNTLYFTYFRITHLSVGFGVLEETQHELGRLNGPSGLGDTERLSLGSTTNTTVESSEGDGTLVVLDVVQVGNSLVEGHAIDGGSSLTSVLEVNTEVASTSLDGCISKRKPPDMMKLRRSRYVSRFPKITIQPSTIH
jgi:hypothetical protein